MSLLRIKRIETKKVLLNVTTAKLSGISGPVLGRPLFACDAEAQRLTLATVKKFHRQAATTFRKKC
jgi:hypothetical protein